MSVFHFLILGLVTVSWMDKKIDDTQTYSFEYQNQEEPEEEEENEELAA